MRYSFPSVVRLQLKVHLAVDVLVLSVFLRKQIIPSSVVAMNISTMFAYPVSLSPTICLSKWSHFTFGISAKPFAHQECSSIISSSSSPIISVLVDPVVWGRLLRQFSIQWIESYYFTVIVSFKLPSILGMSTVVGSWSNKKPSTWYFWSLFSGMSPTSPQIPGRIVLLNLRDLGTYLPIAWCSAIYSTHAQAGPYFGSIFWVSQTLLRGSCTPVGGHRRNLIRCLSPLARFLKVYPSHQLHTSSSKSWIF